MNRNQAIAWVFLLHLVGGCGAPPPDSAGVGSRLVVIGIDSASWELLDPAIEAGELPHLAALRERGFAAELETVEPLFSPPNWTSIATGASPERHGITSFFADRRHVRVPAVWERLAAGGLRVGVYDYLVTWPPRALPGGAMIPGWLRRDDRTWPAELAARLGKPPYVYEVIDMGGLDEIVDATRRELREKPADLNLLVETLDLDVGFVSFYAFDVISHRFFHAYAPELYDPPIAVEPRFAGIIPETLRRVDAAVGEITATLDREDSVIVVSDHGSSASDPVARMWGYDASWILAQTGLEEAAGVEAINAFIFAVFKVAAGPDAAEAVDRLEAFVRSIRTPSGESFFDVRAFRDPVGSIAEAEPWQAEVMAPRLPAFGFVFASVIPEVMDELWPGGEVMVAGETGTVRTVALERLVAPHDFTGDHDPTAFFLAAGPAVARGLPRGRLSVLDVAPLVLYLAGQPLTDDLEGRLPTEILDPGWLADHPVRILAADEAPRLPPEADVALDGAESEEIRERLRALGYLGQ